MFEVKQVLGYALSKLAFKNGQVKKDVDMAIEQHYVADQSLCSLQKQLQKVPLHTVVHFIPHK